jgi:hypothetical protein
VEPHVEDVVNPLGAFLDQRRPTDMRVADVWRALSDRGISVDRSLVYRWFRSDRLARPVPLDMFEPLAVILGLSNDDRLEGLRLASAAPVHDEQVEADDDHDVIGSDETETAA